MRKVSAIFMLLLLGMVLVACGAEDDEPEVEPTQEPTLIVETEPTVDADVGIPGTPDIDPEEVSTPDTIAVTPAAAATIVGGPSTPVVPASPAATPAPVVINEPATPEVIGSPAATPMMVPDTEQATPVATPQIDASPMASPEIEPDAGLAIMPPAGEPVPTEESRIFEMKGFVVLEGQENEAYVVTEEGCVGLGEYADLQAGRQVVVRNEDGTIISVAQLDTSDERDGCAWEFVVQVPESNFYSVSVPMMFEQVFPKGQVNENGGEVTVELP